MNGACLRSRHHALDRGVCLIATIGLTPLVGLEERGSAPCSATGGQCPRCRSPQRASVPPGRSGESMESGPIADGSVPFLGKRR